MNCNNTVWLIDYSDYSDYSDLEVVLVLAASQTTEDHETDQDLADKLEVDIAFVIDATEESRHQRFFNEVNHKHRKFVDSVCDNLVF